MILKKKKYTNYIIFTDGSSIKKKSFKNQKVVELFKDNYSPSYIANLNKTNQINLSNNDTISKFLNKFKND